MIFSEKLRELRLEKGLTQDQLAEKCGLSHGCIAMLEKAKRAPTATTLGIFADFFSVSTDYLLGRSDELGVISFKHESQAAHFSTEEENLLLVFRQLSPKNKLRVAAYADIQLENQYER